MFRLAWTTDIHLNLLRIRGGAKAFGEYLAEETFCDALVVTGDISEAPKLRGHLEDLEAGVGKPVYFVLGNHDYYDGSFEEGLEIARSFKGWLQERPAVELTPEVCLVGNEGWYDALCGRPYGDRLGMSDWLVIRELKEAAQGRVIPEFEKPVDPKAKENLIHFCRKRSETLAAEARVHLEAALKTYQRVIFATHYPPFEEACWHEGAVSDDYWRPWFTSKLMGAMLLEVAAAHPDRKILTLCGHTHSSGVYDAAPNLKVLTGEAVYRRPELAGIFTLDGNNVLAEMKLNKSPYSLVV